MSSTIGDIARYGTGDRHRCADLPPRQPPTLRPSTVGYTGIMAYLPSRKLSVAIVTTQLPRSAGDSRSYASLLFSKLSAYLTPGHRVSLGGG